MSRFDYPKMNRREIISIITDLQIASVTEADLINPNPEFISGLYTELLIHISCIQEDLGLVEFSNVEQFENPDLHVDSVRMINLYNKIKGLLDALQCPTRFILKDLIRPDVDRTELFLSAIINYCLHRDSRMNLLGPFVEETSKLDEQKQEYENRISQLRAEISEFNESREKEMPHVQEVDAKINEMRQSIQALNKHQLSLKETIRKKKDSIKDMDEKSQISSVILPAIMMDHFNSRVEVFKISNAEFALVKSVQENASLRSKIVQSPAKLQRALEEKKAIQVEARNAERGAIQSFHEKSTILEVYTKASKKITKHLKQMETLQEQVNSAKQVEKDVKVLKSKNSDDGVLDKSLEAKLFEQQGKVDQHEELLKQAEKERDLNCEEASKEVNNVRSQLEYNKGELEQRQKNVEALFAEGAAINEKIKLVNDSAAAEQQMLLHKCEEVTKKLFEYSNATGNLLSQIEADAERAGAGTK